MLRSDLSKGDCRWKSAGPGVIGGLGDTGVQHGGKRKAGVRGGRGKSKERKL